MKTIKTTRLIRTDSSPDEIIFTVILVVPLWDNVPTVMAHMFIQCIVPILSDEALTTILCVQFGSLTGGGGVADISHKFLCKQSKLKLLNLSGKANLLDFNDRSRNRTE